MFEFPPLSERSPQPFYLQPLLSLISVVALSLSPKHNYRLLFLLALTVPIYAALPFYTTGDVTRDYLIGCAFGIQIFLVADFFLLSKPEAEFWRVDECGKAVNGKRGWEGNGWSLEKFWWSAGIWSTARGIGWSWEVKNTNPKPPVGYPVWKFALEHTFKLIWIYLVIDAIDVFKSTTPQSHDPPARLSDEPLFRQVLLSWVAWIRAYFGIALAYSMSAVVFTTSGIYSPRDCPPIFGPISDSWTLRRFWGRTWHQMMRRTVTVWGRFVAHTFGFRKGSNASSYTQLYIGFLVSGIIHIFAAYSSTRREIGELRFFLSQAVAITAEDIVIAGAKRLGWHRGGWFGRALGYLWVVAWLSYSLRDWIGGLVAVGGWKQRALPFSVVERVLELWHA